MIGRKRCIRDLSYSNDLLEEARRSYVFRKGYELKDESRSIFINGLYEAMYIRDTVFRQEECKDTISSIWMDKREYKTTFKHRLETDIKQLTFFRKFKYFKKVKYE